MDIKQLYTISSYETAKAVYNKESTSNYRVVNAAVKAFNALHAAFVAAGIAIRNGACHVANFAISKYNNYLTSKQVTKMAPAAPQEEPKKEETAAPAPVALPVAPTSAPAEEAPAETVVVEEVPAEVLEKTVVVEEVPGEGVFTIPSFDEASETTSVHSEQEVAESETSSVQAEEVAESETEEETVIDDQPRRNLCTRIMCIFNCFRSAA